MGIVSGARAVALPFLSVNRTMLWLASGKLSKKQVVKCAVFGGTLMRANAWHVLNSDISLIVGMAERGGAGISYFGGEVGQLLTHREAKPKTIAAVLGKLIALNFTNEEIYAASRIIGAHPIEKQGDIMSELGALDRALFYEIHRVL